VIGRIEAVCLAGDELFRLPSALTTQKHRLPELTPALQHLPVKDPPQPPMRQPTEAASCASARHSS
jgi:hypothetical protein